MVVSTIVITMIDLCKDTQCLVCLVVGLRSRTMKSRQQAVARGVSRLNMQCRSWRIFRPAGTSGGYDLPVHVVRVYRGVKQQLMDRNTSNYVQRATAIGLRSRQLMACYEASPVHVTKHLLITSRPKRSVPLVAQ